MATDYRKIPKSLYTHMHMHIDMTKVISLSNQAYQEMKALKQKDESFSDVVLRLANKMRKRPLMDFFGKWPGSKEELNEIKKMLEKDRKNAKLRDVKL